MFSYSFGRILSSKRYPSSEQEAGQEIHIPLEE